MFSPKLFGSLIVLIASCCSLRAADFEVRAFGATGDGRTVDTAAIQRAIDAAAAAGGGTVRFSAGTYLSYSIRLQSFITLALDAGATLRAAVPGLGRYDAAEPNEWGEKYRYQDFGHSHWHNSLIWGENVHDVAIVGQGLIDGTAALSRGVEGGSISRGERTLRNLGEPPANPTVPGAPILKDPVDGEANKAIALKRCRNVLLRDVSILNGGHFALLATGVDNLVIENVKVDTNRDGFDIDSCRNVRLANCHVNTPNDDAIVLKSSYALGEARACENVAITNCQVSGYDVGTLLDGTFQRTNQFAPDGDGPAARIKLGTESNGGFKNIAISNCVFDRSRGLGIETVDGGPVENIVIDNLTMREVTSSPFFFRLGNRARGPAGVPVATMRQISISNVIASDVDARYPAIIAGIPGHPIEGLRLRNIRLQYRGGLTMDDAARQPAELINPFFRHASGKHGGPNNTEAAKQVAATPAPDPSGAREPFAVPERETSYPESSMFGVLPAYGLFVRHATDLVVEIFEVDFAKEDGRPAIVVMDSEQLTFAGVRARRAASAAFFALRKVRDFATHGCPGLPDTQREATEAEELP